MARKKYTDVSLFNDYNYETIITIYNVSMIMAVGYNSRNKLRWISLTDRTGGVLLPRTFVTHNKQCELSFLSNKNNLDYVVTLTSVDSTKTFDNNHDYSNWADDFVLTFSGTSFMQTSAMENNFRKLVVGN